MLNNYILLLRVGKDFMYWDQTVNINNSYGILFDEMWNVKKQYKSKRIIKIKMSVH